MGAGRFGGRNPLTSAPALKRLLVSALFAIGAHAIAADAAAVADFFETRVQPLLVARCYECHSHGKKIKGGLALDSRSGWEKGGESGPAVIPGSPEKSLLIAAIGHGDPDTKMPPKEKLPDAEIATLVDWVKRGAPDPRPPVPAGEWETVYRERLGWWSLQPVAKLAPPPVKDAEWPRNEVDRFILAGLEAKGLKPAAEAEARVLTRRLSFALTGLPPRSDAPEPSSDALVQSLLDSPHFGERWARHWMDVVHYSDTHGYEWDAPAKHAWRYRDYLVRAFNADVPFRQLVLEQIAGDLIEPRIDPATGLNESMLGPMAMRLGERRHGDNAAAEGVTQEAMANLVDTVSKGFLATTVACAQCHDHKLDAVAQRDYYALAGVFMSTRWGVRCADAVDPNLGVIDELRRIKQEMRGELAKLWLGAKEGLGAKLKAIPANDKAAAAFPETIAGWLQRPTPIAPHEFNAERERRAAENEANLKLLADFTHEDRAAGWKWDGFGMKHGQVRDGEIVVADEGDAALTHLLPAGRWSHVWSMRLAGALRSPLLEHDPPTTFSVGFAGGRHVAQSMIVDQAFHSERMAFLNQPAPGWLTLTAGNFDRIAGGLDRARRRVYLEIVTKSLNNYFPPRSNYGGWSESDMADERSWFGVTRIYQHPPGKPPRDELARFAPLLAREPAKTREELATGCAELLMSAIERWTQNRCDSEDVRLINEALTAQWLSNATAVSPELAKLVAAYRAAEKRLQPDRTIGSVAEWDEGRDERIGVRGSYTELGDTVPRGNISFLQSGNRASPNSSGRLELARDIASDASPLTARVFVNRVWLQLFGEGLVRTPDDFGHLGEKPSHPELLDWLASRFIEDGWSLKKLVQLLVTSAAWRQSSRPSEAALTADPENRLWHYRPMRRLDAEAIRDSMLAVAGRLDPTLSGPPIDPHRAAQDSPKRLFIGPLDGRGRRSLYLNMTLMEPPRFLALFNQPLPKLTTGKRDATNVPDQALALLNDPFVIAMAKHWSERVLRDGATSPEHRAAQMFVAALARSPTSEEAARLVKLARRAAELRGTDSGALMTCQPVWQDVAHALLNLKEFIYVD